MIGPSWHHRAEVLNVVTFPRASKHQFPQPSTTVVLDQIQTRSVSIFVKGYYAWVNKASCSHRRLLLLRTKVSSTPRCFVVLWFLKGVFHIPAITQLHKASISLLSVSQMPWTKITWHWCMFWFSAYTVLYPFLFDFTKSLFGRVCFRTDTYLNHSPSCDVDSVEDDMPFNFFC